MKISIKSAELTGYDWEKLTNKINQFDSKKQFWHCESKNYGWYNTDKTKVVEGTLLEMIRQMIPAFLSYEIELEKQDNKVSFKLKTHDCESHWAISSFKTRKEMVKYYKAKDLAKNIDEENINQELSVNRGLIFS